MDRYDPVGEIVAIYTQNKKGGPRELISEGFFEKGKGLLGDAYSKGGIRQVSIFTAEGKEEIASSGLIVET